jgi:ribonucrease Y
MPGTAREREPVSGKGRDVDGGIVLALVIVCVVALAALVALLVVIRRNSAVRTGSGALPATPASRAAQQSQAGPIDSGTGHTGAGHTGTGHTGAVHSDRSDAVHPGTASGDTAEPETTQPPTGGPASNQVPAGQVPAGQVPAGQVPAGQVAPGQVPAMQAAAAQAAAARVAAAQVAAATEAAAQLRQVEQEAVRRAEDLRVQAEQSAAAIVARADALAAQTDEARREVDAEIKAVKEEVRLLRADLERREVRLAEREQRMDEEARKADQRADALEETRRDLDRQRGELEQLETQRREVLERVAGLTRDQAKSELVAGIENQAKREAALIVRDIEGAARKEGDKRARKIVTLAIQRVASDQTSESVVSVLHLPGDEMKGRIIGREGRNIRAFESVTGVNLIIDDTPEAVLLSCFDPVRREIGRLTLERLVLDGRIHPQRIEEAFERSKAEIEQLCVRAGEDALVDVGITEMDPELTNLLGRLRYRTSYGQNVLKHLIESAHIAGMMASELGLDPVLMKRGTLLHDIGKALTHEVQGSHALIGAEIARRYGESPDVVHAIEAHHNEVEVRTVEAVLTQAADAISGGRPGARRESLEAYVKRLERLEQIAMAQGGVEKVFAMQAGREVRIMVKPGDVDDIQAQVIARDVAKQVEEELTYPGQIRVTVVRESRAIEFAR